MNVLVVIVLSCKAWASACLVYSMCELMPLASPVVCPTVDAFIFAVARVTNCVGTKRALLSVIARAFDSVGFIMPVMMEGKIIFQQLWSLGVKWDDPIPSNLQHRRSDWLSDLSSLQDAMIPRCLFPNLGWSPGSVSFKLHQTRDVVHASVWCMLP